MKKILAVFALLFFVAGTFNSCSKGKCFDEDLYYNNKNNGCTADCPGVTGCDGKTYCNECEANKKGIRVVH